MSTSGGGASALPAGATAVQATSVGANSVVTATMPAVVGKTNFLSKVIVSSDGATATLSVVLGVGGVVGPFGTVYNVPVTGSAAPPFQLDFATPLPGSGANQAVSVSLPALGAGNTAARVTLIGYTV